MSRPASPLDRLTIALGVVVASVGLWSLIVNFVRIFAHG